MSYELKEFSKKHEYTFLTPSHINLLWLNYRVLDEWVWDEVTSVTRKFVQETFL